MTASKQLPIALTIAGSDSGGGAGIQADLKTFAALGVHGTSVITCLTAQNPRAVLGVEASTPKFISQQLEAVFTELPPAAIKTGMLYSTAIIETVATFIGSLKRKPPLIVDPVLVATSGAVLLAPTAIKVLARKLLPLAELITPNIPEAEALTGSVIREPEDLRSCARQLHRAFGCTVLLKGGHLTNSTEAIDIFYDGNSELMLSAPFLKGRKLHGTGCTYSAAITAYRARGYDLPGSIKRAKEFITTVIADSPRAGKHYVLSGGTMTRKAFGSTQQRAGK